MLSIALGFLLAGCAAGEPATPQATSQVRTSPVDARVIVKFPKRPPAVRRGSRYVSTATSSVQFALTSVDGGSVPSGYTSSVTISLGTGCTDSSGTYTCSSAWKVPAASDGFTVTAYSGAGATGSELSRNTLVKAVSTGSSTIAVTLDGIPASVTVVPASGSSVTGTLSAGLVAQKCGSPQNVDVYGVDAGGDDIIGSGGPTVSLSSGNTGVVTVATPAPSTPNEFALSYPLEESSTNVTLTAGATPLSGSGGTVKSASGTISVGGGDAICGVVTIYPLPHASSMPNGVALGPDGNVWFTECAGRIGRITTSGVITEYSSGLLSPSLPGGIVEGPDKNLWFADNEGRIGKSTTAGTITEYTAGFESDADPADITVGPDDNLWFTEAYADRIGKITTAGTVTEYTAGMTASSRPLQITKGPDGNLWFAELCSGAIGKVTTAGTITEYTNANKGPGIAVGADDNLWHTVLTTETIGDVQRITTAGAVTEYSALGGPMYLTEAPDGTLWYTFFCGAQLGRVTTAGAITEYTYSGTNSECEGGGYLTTGADGYLWFADDVNDSIDRVR